jgi:hypothetical protein
MLRSLYAGGRREPGNNMMNALARSKPAIWVWAAASAATTLYWQFTQGEMGIMEAFLAPGLWISAILGLGIACAFSPVLAAPWVRWYWGALLGVPMGFTVLTCFFLVKPHSWQATRWDAWKSAGLFIAVYPWLIVPACLFAGGMGAWLMRQDVPPTG